MRKAPKHRIANNALKAWRIREAFIVMIIWIGLTVYPLRYVYLRNEMYFWLAIGLTIVISYVLIFVIPKIKWLRWRYEIFESEVYLQHGIFIVTRTLVPMMRVQHVDTKQGPILKKFGLATVQISTAATTHEIPALLEDDASRLRDSIAELARVVDEDV